MDILYPEPMSNSDIKAKGEAFFNVQLFKDIYETYRDKPTVEQVEWLLRRKAMQSHR